MFTMIIALCLSMVFLLFAGLCKKEYGNKNREDFPDQYQDYILSFYFCCSVSAMCFAIFASYIFERL